MRLLISTSLLSAAILVLSTALYAQDADKPNSPPEKSETKPPEKEPEKKPEKDPQRDLLKAIRAGDLEAAKQALKQGADANVPARFGVSPLSYAADRNRADIVAVLLAASVLIAQARRQSPLAASSLRRPGCCSVMAASQAT